MKNPILRTLPLALAALIVGATPAMAGKANDTLVWSTDREAAVADPYYNNIRELVIIGMTAWDMLLHLNLDTGEYEPLLAKSYKWVDNTTLEFELRKDVVFHNGKKFSADDVVGTFNHVSSDESGVMTKRNVSWIKKAEKLGSHKVRIHLAKPFPAALEFLSGPMAILPGDIWKTAEKDAAGKPDYGTIAPVCHRQALVLVELRLNRLAFQTVAEWLD